MKGGERYECSLAGAQAWVADGRPCIFRRGFAFRGKQARPLSQAEASELLSSGEWGFGMGFHVLSYPFIDGRDFLEFNELSLHDLE